MKKIFLILFTLFIFINVKALDINSKNAILYNLNDHNIIYEKNSHDKVQVASLTKIVTAITVIENVDDLNEKVVITKDMLKGLDGYAKVGLKENDSLTILELLYALMLPSGADAANALAIYTSGSIEEFSKLMNEQIKKIGVSNSNFDNPVGMDSKFNYSTAYDMSKILIYSLKNDTFKEIFNSNEKRLDSIDKVVKKTYVSASQDYNIDLKIIMGAKTGFTYDAGLCLASTTTLNGVDYLLVTLGADYNYPNHLTDTINIYEYYSNNYDYINILNKGKLLKTIKVKNSKTKIYNIYSKDDVSLYLEKSINKDNLIYKYEGIEELTKDIKKKDKLGKIDIINNNKIIYTYDIYLNDDIKYYNYPLYIIIGIIILISIIFTIKLLRKLLNRV